MFYCSMVIDVFLLPFLFLRCTAPTPLKVPLLSIFISRWNFGSDSNLVAFGQTKMVTTDVVRSSVIIQRLYKRPILNG
jgi:hypothetical protein